MLNDLEKICMRTDRLDDGSVVVNFDLFDNKSDEVVGDGGYVYVRQDDSYFGVTVFNCDGKVLTEVNVPFKFNRINEDESISN